MKWISVKDGLPENCLEVIALDGIFVCIAYYLTATGKWGDDQGSVETVTHWMPLPAPPGEGER